MSFVVFLDIDGVLNTGEDTNAPQDRFGDAFNPDAVENLSKVIAETGAVIVVSSSWKFFGLDKMQEMWKERNLPGQVIGITPNTISDEMLLNANLDDMDSLGFKGLEINEWLSKHGKLIDKYAILDDENNFLPEQQPHFVQTNPKCGITKEDAKRVIKILNTIK